MSTFYRASLDRPRHFAPFAGPREVDAAVIGGGFAGLSTALGLLERGRRDIVVLEAGPIGAGASGRNGGFVSAGFSLDALKLRERIGGDAARQLYRLSQDAVRCMRERIDRYRIDCAPVDSGMLVADWFADPRPLREWQRQMQLHFGVDWGWLSRDEVHERLLSRRYHAALHDPAGFHFDPLRYGLGLAQVLCDGGATVHEHSRAVAIASEGAGWRVETAQGRLHCRHLVVACGGYIGALVPQLARAVLPIATYAMTTEPLGERLRSAVRTDAAVYDTRFALDYYRALPDTRLLWGGRISVRERPPRQVARLLTADLLRVYPQLHGVQVSHAWSGLMSFSRHKMPQVGRTAGGLWYATGFGGHGVAATTLAGEVLARAIVGEAAIPEPLQGFGLAPTYGPAGRAAAQVVYGWMQARDRLHEWRAALTHR